ncbi:CD63 antigen-like [Homarus americanus]|uniref:CD63 antigen-like n=1 Tax=Homarus americanus TaxID=6706 RepID=UPI001C4752D7|nr:CD63 antigen-like [Homarus americanus]
MGCFSKCGLILVNFFVICLGLSVVGAAAAVLNQDTIFGALLTKEFYTLPITTLMIGIFITLLGVLGCWGAIKENSCLLMTYAVIVSVLLIGMVAIGIALMVFMSGSSAYIVSNMKNIYNQYGEDDKKQLTADLDALQHTLHCCGINGYEDWAHFKYGNGVNVADGCCKNDTEGCGLGALLDPHVREEVYQVGCLSFITEAFGAISMMLAVLTIILASVQLLSVIWACVLARRSNTYEQL